MLQKYIASSHVRPEMRVELTKAEFDELQQAVLGLLHRTDVEENYDCVIENYLELEEYILSEALRSVVARPRSDNISWQEPRHNTARKLANFLSSARLYISTIETHAREISADASVRERIKADIARQFDTSSDYRIMDALRNYAQHSALPVHGYTIGMQRTADLEYVDHNFEPSINVASLALDSAFKKTTLQEIRGGPPSLEIKPLVRGYVESLSVIHDSFRRLTDAAVEAFSASIHAAKERLLAEWPEARPEIGMTLFEADAAGRQASKSMDLTLALSDYVGFLRAKNQKLSQLSRRRIKH